MLNTIAGLESRWDFSGGFRLHARTTPAAPRPGVQTVVLVHGLCVSSRYFVPTAAALAPHFDVYAPDLPGWGRSERPARSLSPADLAESLAGWIERLDLGPAVLVANSVGCQIVARVARHHPSLVDRVVLIGPTFDSVGRNAVEQARRLMVDMLREPPWSWAIHARDFADFGPRRTLETLALALADPLESHLPYVSAPALVVRGERDPIAPHRWAEEVVRRLPQARLVTVPRAAHAANTSHPREVAALVRSFAGRESRQVVAA